MTYAHRTMIVSAVVAPQVRALVVAMAGEPAQGMFTVPLSLTGTLPATHYISSGAIDEQFVPALTDAAVMHQAAQAAGAQITLAQCLVIVAASSVADLADETAQQTMQRLGLKPIQPDA